MFLYFSLWGNQSSLFCAVYRQFLSLFERESRRRKHRQTSDKIQSYYMPWKEFNIRLKINNRSFFGFQSQAITNTAAKRNYIIHWSKGPQTQLSTET